MHSSQAARPDRLSAGRRGQPRSAASDGGGDVLAGGNLDQRASCRARVDAVLDAGAGMGVVERTIEAFALPSEEKAALWLGAWSQRYPLVDDPCEGALLGWGPPGLACERVAAASSGLLGHD